MSKNQHAYVTSLTDLEQSAHCLDRFPTWHKVFGTFKWQGNMFQTAYWREV